MRRPAALSLALALTLVPACGGDDDEPEAAPTEEAEPPTTRPEETEEAAAPAAYAADVCGSLGDWQEELQGSAGGLGDRAAGAGDPAALKQLLVDFLDDAAASTERLRGDIEAAGVPEGEAGEGLATDLSDGLADVQGLFEDSRAEVQGLPDGDAAALGAGVDDVGQDLQESSQRVSRTFTRIGERVAGTELGEAFEAEPACEGLSSPA